MTTKYRWSLKVKWAVGTAVGALVIFACLTFVLFSTFTQENLRQEKQTVTDSVSVLQNQLSEHSSDLTKQTVNQAIRPDDLVQNSTTTPSALYKNDVVSKLSSNVLEIRIVDPDGKELYSNGTILDKDRTQSKKLDLVRRGGTKILSTTEPIKSNQDSKVIGYIHIENHLENYHKSYERLVLIALLVLALVVIASGLLGYFLSYFLLRPIDDLHDTLSAMKDDPTSDKRVPDLHRNDELSDLGQMLNEMMDQVQGYIEQQSQFVEDVSHELRTPVAIIQGHMEMLNRWGKDDPKILGESLDASLKETKRMQDLVQEMLDLSRAEQVEINFRDELTDVGEVVHQVFNNFQMIHPDFTFVLDDDLREKVTVQIYRDHLEQILIILCDNAVKYSAERKEVHLSVSRSTNQVEIGVQDFGEGISQEDMHKVFNRFYRVDKARSRKKGGNGLGLSIAKRLLEGYHGDISLESSAGYGSLFRITLPIRSTEELK